MVIWLIRLPPSSSMEQQKESHSSDLLGAGNYFSASHISGECSTTSLLSSSCVILLGNIVVARKTWNMCPFIRAFTWNIADLYSSFMSYVFFILEACFPVPQDWGISQALHLCIFHLIVINLFLTLWRFPKVVHSKPSIFYKVRFWISVFSNENSCSQKFLISSTEVQIFPPILIKSTFWGIIKYS